MTTYQHGQQPDGAPVTWRKDHEWPSCMAAIQYDDDGMIRPAKVSQELAEIICRAFHLAKLAEEAAAMLESAPLTPHGTTDWLRRYREIVQ